MWRCQLQFEGIRRPDFPPWMFDAVLARAFAPRGVAPIMFGDEFFVRTGRVRLGFAPRGHGEVFPFIAAAPLVLHSHNSVSVFHFAAHRERDIRLAVEDARGDGNGDFGDEFANENNAAPHFGLSDYLFSVNWRKDQNGLQVQYDSTAPGLAWDTSRKRAIPNLKL